MSQAVSTSSAPQNSAHPRNIRNEGLGCSGKLKDRSASVLQGLKDVNMLPMCLTFYLEAIDVLSV